MSWASYIDNLLAQSSATKKDGLFAWIGTFAGAGYVQPAEHKNLLNILPEEAAHMYKIISGDPSAPEGPAFYICGEKFQFVKRVASESLFARVKDHLCYSAVSKTMLIIMKCPNGDGIGAVTIPVDKIREHLEGLNM